jgi:hypothetical protein
MNIFKRIKFYYTYKNITNEIKKDLLENFNVRIDNINRLYTVINIPDETQIYGSEHANALTEEFLRKWLVKFDTFLVNNQIKEFLIREELTKIDDLNYLIVFRYKYLNVEKILYTLYTLGIITFVTFLVMLFLKLL